MPGLRITSGFWYISIPTGRFRRLLQAERAKRDLRQELLTGESVAAHWIPPAYEIAGKGAWPDWMAFWVPLLSERAISALRELLAPHCEFLSWINEPQHHYSLLNITSRIAKDEWSCEESSVYGDEYAAADVISLRDGQIPHVFTLEGYRGKVFVSDAVARGSVEHRLTGVMFVDPSIPALHVPFINSRLRIRQTGFVRREDALEKEQRSLVH